MHTTPPSFSWRPSSADGVSLANISSGREVRATNDIDAHDAALILVRPSSADGVPLANNSSGWEVRATNDVDAHDAALVLMASVVG